MLRISISKPSCHSDNDIYENSLKICMEGMWEANQSASQPRESIVAIPNSIYQLYLRVTVRVMSNISEF